MQVLELSKGSTPLLLSMPHCGTELPESVAALMTPAAMELADTDWHVDLLYDFARELGASVLQPRYSRYLIDLNRPADDSNLYPGANSTGLCPTSDFDQRALYQDGTGPNPEEVQQRLVNYWQPYHTRLQAELSRIKQQHGIAVLFEGHSIRSRVPRLFEGQLPDLNIGTADGSSCSPALQGVVNDVLNSQGVYSHVQDARFKGGYITRAYGSPGEGVHSLQMELAQHLYMEEEHPFTYLPERAAQLQSLLQPLLQAMIDWAQAETA